MLWRLVAHVMEAQGALIDHYLGAPNATSQPRSSPSTSPADSNTVSAAKQLGTLTLAARAMSPTEARRRAGIASNTASWVSLKASVALV